MSNKMIEKKDVFRSLKTNFTEKEKLTIGEAMANAVRERDRLESELTSIKKQYASDIDKQRAEITSLAERLNTGWEMRRVECEEVRDFNNGSVRVYRKDQGESTFITVDHPSGIQYQIVEERAMSAEERQMGLFEEGKGEVVDAEFSKSTELSPEATSLMSSAIDQAREIGGAQMEKGFLGEVSSDLPLPASQDEPQGRGDHPEGVGEGVGEGVETSNLPGDQTQLGEKTKEKDLPDDKSKFYTQGDAPPADVGPHLGVPSSKKKGPKKGTKPLLNLPE